MALAFIAVGGIYLALPSSLIVGPVWLLPTLVFALLVPTVISHRMGRHSLNHALGLTSNAVITLSLIGSVVLLVNGLSSRQEAPLRLLGSGAALWMTNVLVYSLWYWRLDGGGPIRRQERRRFGSSSFLFPQMQVQLSERDKFGCEQWHPRFVDYLFLAFTQSATFGPTDTMLLARWAKVVAMMQIFISLSIVIVLISRAVGAL